MWHWQMTTYGVLRGVIVFPTEESRTTLQLREMGFQKGRKKHILGYIFAAAVIVSNLRAKMAESIPIVLS